MPAVESTGGPALDSLRCRNGHLIHPVPRMGTRFVFGWAPGMGSFALRSRGEQVMASYKHHRVCQDVVEERFAAWNK
jgi:hypothetical protein